MNRNRRGSNARGRSLLHVHRRSQGRGVKKNLGDYGRQTDAPVRSGIRRDVTLVHGVAAFEKHGVRHARAVEMGPGRAPIAGIDVRYHDIAELVHVVAEPGRDMVFVFPDHAILAGRRGKAGLACGNGRFADERVAFEEIGALFPDMDNDSCRAGDAIAVPSVGHGSRDRRGRDRAGRWREFGAAGQEGQDGKGDRASKKAHAAHKDAQSNAFH